MFRNTLSFVLAAACFLAFTTEVHAHGTITSVSGDNGVNGAGFGIIADTPRDGSRPVPFEQDTSVIRDREIKSGKTGVCGRTKAGGDNDVASQLAAASNAGLPTTSSTGELNMTLHQVNRDGAGPYTCDVSTDGGNTFQPAQVTQNVPGKRGNSKAEATDFPLVMQVATTLNCTAGPAGNACIARCRNPALAGPFGSCVAFAMGGATDSSNQTSSDNSTTTSTDDSTTVDSSTDVSTATATDDIDGSTDISTATATDDNATADSSTATSAAVSSASSEIQEAGKTGKSSGKASAKKGKAKPSAKKRLIKSRIAGLNAGYWIDA